jgi:glycosyltransferase involved in cell wall biosynthesis
MEVWATMFAQLAICAPRVSGGRNGNEAPLSAPNVRWHPVDFTQQSGPVGKLRRLGYLPGIARAINTVVCASDLVLLRSPGHLALVGRYLADRRGVPHITKWAGFFGPFKGERLPRRIERYHVLRRRAPVLMYGPTNDPPFVSMPPALMTEDELRSAARSTKSRRWVPPWHILCVGRLSPEKGFDLALRGAAHLAQLAPEIDWQLTFVGTGRMADSLRRLTTDLGLSTRVCFAGALPFDAVRPHYARAHVVIMPGTMEGWPKPIAEAWAHGAVPVAAAAGIVPWIIDGNESGVTFTPTPEGLGETLRSLLANPGVLHQMSDRGPGVAAQLSLEVFGQRVRTVLEGMGLR